jgi:hypothetical protein
MFEQVLTQCERELVAHASERTICADEPKTGPDSDVLTEAGGLISVLRVSLCLVRNLYQH